ncbi:MAG TPA: hypothetical protein VGN95_00200 [Pyrinomonadaceae bacterium]|jgi:hypothetical protein|nr:hypothetical protein [Pyrinomonadaceae bacterium]
MLGRKAFSVFAAFILLIAASVGVLATNAAIPSDKGTNKGSEKVRVETPLNLAILVQDDLVARVGNELAVTRDFIRTLPAGSRVMVAYIRTGSLQVRQPFTDDLEKAAKALRVPVGSETASPYNPYVEVIEALRRFEDRGENRNAMLLISDGLDISHGFDTDSAANTIDLHRAIKEAKSRNVNVYSFYAPTVGLTSRNHLAVSYGQSSLNRLSNETGGRAFFQGTNFVTFDSYFDRLREALNDQYAKAY